MKSILYLICFSSFVFAQDQLVLNKTHTNCHEQQEQVIDITVLIPHLLVRTYLDFRKLINPIVVSQFIDRRKNPYLHAAASLTTDIIAHIAHSKYQDEKRPLPKLILEAGIDTTSQWAEEFVGEKIYDHFAQRNPQIANGYFFLLKNRQFKAVGKKGTIGSVLIVNKAVCYYASQILISRLGTH